MFSHKNRYMFSYKKRRRAELIRRAIVIVLIVAAVIMALLIILSIYSSKIRVSLAKDRTIEINTPGTAAQFIEEVKNGKLIEDQEIDTTVLGEQRCTVKIELEDKPHDFTFTVNVVDTQPPTLELNQTEINILKGANYDVLSKSKAEDNSGEEVGLSISGDFDPDTVGEQVVSVVATDSSGNTAEKEVTLNVIEIAKDMRDTIFLTGTGHSAEIKNGILYVDDILIVNRTFSVPEDFTSTIDKDTATAFNRMAEQAAREGILLVINRSYRSYTEQEQAYTYFSEVLGEGADTMSSIKPGHSEHQTGLAIDVNVSSGYFSQTPEAKWLAANCHKYGFIIRYPEGKEAVTGCAYEPWHVRYVGDELAEELYNDGEWIALEEYFGIPSRYLD